MRKNKLNLLKIFVEKLKEEASNTDTWSADVIKELINYVEYYKDIKDSSGRNSLEEFKIIVDDWAYERIAEHEGEAYREVKLEFCFQCTNYRPDIDSCSYREEGWDYCQSIMESMSEGAHEAVREDVENANIVEIFYDSIGAYLNSGGKLYVKNELYFDYTGDDDEILKGVLEEIGIDKVYLDIGISSSMYFNYKILKFFDNDFCKIGDKYFYDIK